MYFAHCLLPSIVGTITCARSVIGGIVEYDYRGPNTTPGNNRIDRADPDGMLLAFGHHCGPLRYGGQS